MTHDPAGRSLRRSGVLLLAAALVAVAVVGPPHPTPAQAADVADSYRARYHFTVPDHWKNDPQRPVVIDGTTHYYYLYNADYDDAVGTAWRLATTTDNVVFHDQGVAAPKATNANYDLWSGSAVVDTAGTAGFGAGCGDHAGHADGPPDTGADPGRVRTAGAVPLVLHRRRPHLPAPRREHRSSRTVAAATSATPR